MVRKGRLIAALLASLALTSGGALAQGAQTDSEKEIERYRAMISDPMSNPGFLAVDRGEVLWAQKRGTKNAGLESCDLGEGPGKLEGAYAKLPRYFKDVDQVMDLEQRLLHCMKTEQGLDTADIVKRKFSGPGRASDMEDLVAYIANKSTGMKIAPQLSHPKEKEMAEIGEAMFYRRAGTHDFACATCHGPDAAGSATLPRLAGQHVAYTEDQLKLFNKRERTNDNAVMHTVAEKMTPLEMAAVSEYLSGK